MIKLFLAGDVMTGRAIDQILPYPGNPQLFEPDLRSALDYVALAGHANGRIPRPVSFDYIWGDALDELFLRKPDIRIANLETAVTVEQSFERKSINYRMHPHNVAALTAAGLDCCVLANNHVLDWGERGLLDTLIALRRAGIQTAGAGRDLAEASQPAILKTGRSSRILVFSFGLESSGIPPHWAAGDYLPGV
jgi:poly-gamma-glutamate synthesis protein (capsule biosynthesis protein)